jgi:hypothetical protein
MASRGSYPHPVLDNSDDITGDFRITRAIVTPTSEAVGLQFDVRIDNAEVQSLFDAGALSLRARWKCSATFASDALELAMQQTPVRTLECTAELDHEDLDGRVDVSVVLVAAKRLGWSLRSQHEDYGTLCFDVPRGGIVANAGTFSFDARKSYDPMRPPLESCFRFVRKADKSKFIDIDSSLEERVDVFIPQGDYERFADQGGSPEVQLAAVVLPALVQALIDVQTEEPDTGGWKAALRSLCAKHGVEGRPPLIQAQAILGDPISTGLGRLSLLLHGEDED